MPCGAPFENVQRPLKVFGKGCQAARHSEVKKHESKQQ